MSTELTLQTQSLELANAKQEIEILKLKNELQKVQAQKASRLEDSLFAPSLMVHYQKVAEFLAKSSIIPKDYKEKPADIFVAMSMGYQLGFPVEQSLQDIAVINGRPCLWGDGLAALIVKHPECLGYEEEPIYTGKTVSGYKCTILRKGHAPHSKTFTLDDAARAGLLKKPGPWTNYPERMLQMRARGFAFRDKFPDALRGLRMAEEALDMPEDGQTIDAEVIKKEDKQVDKLKSILKQKTIIQNESVASEDKVEELQIKNDMIQISPEQITEIENVFTEKNFNEERIEKALNYFKVANISELNQTQFQSLQQHLARI